MLHRTAFQYCIVLHFSTSTFAFTFPFPFPSANQIKICNTVDLLLKVVDLEKLSYKCASLVKIGANYVELILGLEILGWKRPICWPRVDLSVRKPLSPSPFRRGPGMS